MTVKLSLLKSGEDVIADIQEMILDDKVVGYFFVNPCVVKVLAKDTGTQGKTPCQLQLTPWLPLTDEKKITLALLISRLLQRLNGQKWLGAN